jgi:drug/metabolite transporter (DMT)-like permease
MISKKLIYSFTATFSMALSVFFEKIALSKNALLMPLIIQFAIICFLILSINLFIFQKKDTKEKIKNIKMQNWKNFILAGFFNVSAILIGAYGLQLTTSINFSFIIKSNLIFVPILAFFFLQEKITTVKILLIITFFSGIYLIITGGKIIIPHFCDLLILLAAFFFSLASIIQKTLIKLFGPEINSWGTASCSAFFALVLSIILKINIFSLKAILFVFLVGLLNSLLLLFHSKTIEISNLTYYVMMTMLAPIINIFLGFLFLRETINLIQIIGGIVLLLSGFLVQKLKV